MTLVIVILILGFSNASVILNTQHFEPSTKKTEDKGKLVIIPRSLWAALPAKTKVARKNQFKEVIYTDTDTRTCSTKQDCTKLIKELQKYHMELKGLPDIDYHFLIGGDGNVYEGRGWHTLTSLNEKESPEGDADGATEESTLEVAFIGSYKEGEIPKELKDVAENLISYGIENQLLYTSDMESDTDKDSDEGNNNDQESTKKN